MLPPPSLRSYSGRSPTSSRRCPLVSSFLLWGRVESGRSNGHRSYNRLLYVRLSPLSPSLSLFLTISARLCCAVRYLLEYPIALRFRRMYMKQNVEDPLSSVRGLFQVWRFILRSQDTINRYRRDRPTVRVHVPHATATLPESTVGCFAVDAGSRIRLPAYPSVETPQRPRNPRTITYCSGHASRLRRCSMRMEQIRIPAAVRA
ncbi:hypothetical protein BD414DRAFT_180613 [Trametes punicea]|nr:hypothetical protein BD414DRAFT_180613 [Trametes punicea]